MKGILIAATFVAAALFAAPAAAASDAFAVERDIVQSGAVEYVAPTNYDLPDAPPAAIDGNVDVPVGSWFSALLDAFQVAILGFFLWLFRKLPQHAVTMIDQVCGLFLGQRAEQLLNRAVEYGINATQDAVRDKSLSFKVGNEVLERAFEYAIRHAPTVVRLLGGEKLLREKLIARIKFDADSGVPTPRPLAEALVGRDAPAATAALQPTP